MENAPFFIILLFYCITGPALPSTRKLPQQVLFAKKARTENDFSPQNRVVG
jgi:hypothetical protein